MPKPQEDGPCVITPGCPGKMHATPHHDRIDWRCNGCACTTCDQLKAEPVEEQRPAAAEAATHVEPPQAQSVRKTPRP